MRTPNGDIYAKRRIFFLPTTDGDKSIPFGKGLEQKDLRQTETMKMENIFPNYKKRKKFKTSCLKNETGLSIKCLKRFRRHRDVNYRRCKNTYT